MNRFLFALAAAMLVFAAPSFAEVVTFDDVNPPGPSPIITSVTSGSFDFSSTHMHHIDETFRTDLVQNGTFYLLEEAGSLGGPITMVRSNGSAFDLASFDGAEWRTRSNTTSGFPNADAIRVDGTKSGGGAVSALFALDGIADGPAGVADFQTFFLPGTFTNLVSVTFTGFQVTGARGGFSIDNLNTTVPEPTTLALLGLGLAGIALARRRRTA